jgi:hypothetical protein
MFHITWMTLGGLGHCATTIRPAVPKLQPLHPAGAASDEMGKNILFETGSTATECALFPVGNWLNSLRVPASMVASTGVQGDAVVQAGPEDFPDFVQRLAAL